METLRFRLDGFEGPLDLMLHLIQRHKLDIYDVEITRLLDQYEGRRGKLPLLDHALLVIEELCDVDSRQVYDEDNKGWKAVSNAIKGRLVRDDDQFSLSLCLLAQRSPEKTCHIYVLPVQDAGDFFFMRSDHFPFSR